MMKTIVSFIVLFVCMLITVSAVAAEFYKLTNVKRIEDEVYEFRSDYKSGLLITKYCHEYVSSDDAILRYDRYGSNNKIMFSSGATCDVVKVVFN